MFVRFVLHIVFLFSCFISENVVTCTFLTNYTIVQTCHFLININSSYTTAFHTIHQFKIYDYSIYIIEYQTHALCHFISVYKYVGYIDKTPSACLTFMGLKTCIVIHSTPECYLLIIWSGLELTHAYGILPTSKNHVCKLGVQHHRALSTLPGKSRLLVSKWEASQKLES